MEELWKDVFGYEGIYRVSTFGKISTLNYRGTGIEKCLKPNKNKSNYYQVILYKNKVKKTLLIHRIVLMNFIENTENKPCVNHKDGNKLNNRIENLEWSTIKENCIHAYKTGLSKALKGTEVGGSKLNESQVLEIRRFGNYKPMKDIAKDYGVATMTICRILNHKTWKHI